MPKGFIITFGEKAVTVQNEQKEQFYAPIECVDKEVYNKLTYPFYPINVSYDINYEKFSGTSNKKKRYYAYNVKLIDYVIF